MAEICENRWRGEKQDCKENNYKKYDDYLNMKKLFFFFFFNIHIIMSLSNTTT